MNKRSIFTRLILFTVEGYLADIDPKVTYNYAFLLRIRTAIRMFIQGHRFSREEFLIVNKLSGSDFMNKLVERQVDRTIYAIELLTLYIMLIDKAERATLNISDKKILNLKSEFVMDMLKMRMNKPEEHQRVKQIVEDTRINAKMFFNYCEEEICGK